MDLTTVAINAGYLTAIVALVRKYVPKVDGVWTLLVAAVGAALLAFVACAPDWMAVGKCAILVWVGAVGGVNFVQKSIDRANSLPSWTITKAETRPEQPTKAETPEAKKDPS